MENNNSMLLKFSKIFLLNSTEEGNLTEVSLLVFTDFARFLQIIQFSVKKIIVLKSLNFFTKSLILDVWRVQNLHLTLINEKSFSFICKTESSSQLVFI